MFENTSENDIFLSEKVQDHRLNLNKLNVKIIIFIFF